MPRGTEGTRESFFLPRKKSALISTVLSLSFFRCAEQESERKRTADAVMRCIYQLDDIVEVRERKLLFERVMRIK